MNNRQNTANFFFLDSENHKAFIGFVKNTFAVNSILGFDIFQYSNTYNEKLPIIYANIRV